MKIQIKRNLDKDIDIDSKHYSVLLRIANKDVTFDEIKGEPNCRKILNKKPSKLT